MVSRLTAGTMVESGIGHHQRVASMPSHLSRSDVHCVQDGSVRKVFSGLTQMVRALLVILIFFVLPLSLYLQLNGLQAALISKAEKACANRDSVTIYERALYDRRTSEARAGVRGPWWTLRSENEFVVSDSIPHIAETRLFVTHLYYKDVKVASLKNLDVIRPKLSLFPETTIFACSISRPVLQFSL